MKKRIVLFGTGYQGKEAYKLLGKQYEIVCFVDNNPAKEGCTCMGINTYRGDEILEHIDDETDILICSENYYCEIEEQLILLGIKRFYVYYDGDIYNGGIREDDEPVKICTRCVMDNSSDKYILFKDNGECNYCTSALKRMKKEYFPNEEGQQKLEELLNNVKEAGKNKKYDCIMGISGGLDSSYLLYLGYRWGLRVLAVHIDDGFDTDISKANLSKLIQATGYDYEVIKPDPEQFKDLTLAYMEASVPNIAVPQDNVLFAYIYKRMKECNLKFFLTGGNFALESILQKGNTHSFLDIDNLLKIHERFGKKGIDRLEFISLEDIIENKETLGITTPRALNYVDYNRHKALNELHEFCGFEYYGNKHLENKLTAFAQLYWFPAKFGVDKRKSHFSSMIVSGQMKRELAIKELEKPLLKDEKVQNYIDYVKRELNLNEAEFNAIMNHPGVEHTVYG